MPPPWSPPVFTWLPAARLFYALVPTAQTVVTWVGAATAIFAATIAVGQYDIKKVLAYSTISQLGFMVAAVGMGATVAGMFHLVTHAFFKGLLFLAAGSVIQGVERGMHHGTHADHATDPQDMRQMGGLRKQMPLTFWVYLIGALALAGIAPLAGFFSKDEILAHAWQAQPAVFIVLAAAAFLTAFYMGRQLIMVFFGKPNSKAAEHATESPLVVTLPLVILAGLSVLGGALNLPGVHTLGNLALPHARGRRTGALQLACCGHLPRTGSPRSGSRLADLRPQTRSCNGRSPQQKLGPVFTGMEHKWWVDELYQTIILNPYKAFALFMAEPVDLGVIDRIGGGLAAGTRALAEGIRKTQNGYIRTYALWMLLGLAVIMTYLFFK